MVTREIAKAEITKWMDHKRVKQSKREQHEEHVEFLIDAIQGGDLSYDQSTGVLKQKLLFPIQAKVGDKLIDDTKELSFKPRVHVKTINQQMAGVKPADTDGRVLAYVAALTGLPKGIVGNLDTEDYAIGQNISIFFM